jgi:Protease II
MIIKRFITLKKIPVTLRSEKIFKHVLGTPVSEDVEVYHEKDDTFNTYVTKSKSKKYIIIGAHSSTSTEYQFLDADTPNGTFKIIQPREKRFRIQCIALQRSFLHSYQCK